MTDKKATAASIALMSDYAGMKLYETASP
ncbi:hypothetical protein FHT92_005970, partial [Rhizobium sp. BK377]|nr:hypothetical protein [Rhizobium sp. BK377]